MRSGDPDIRLVTAWIDPQDASVWSGTLRSLTRELSALGAYGGNHDVTPPALPTRLVQRSLSITHRNCYLWQLRLEGRALIALNNAWHRFRDSEQATRWIVPTGALGRPVDGPFCTWGETSPAHLAAAFPTHTASIGFPGLTPRGLRSLSRQHVRLYRKATVCCLASTWAADSLVRDHGIEAAKVRVVGYGRNVEVAPPPGRDWTVPRFLFVGRDWERKNGAAVVRAFRRLREEVPEAELHLEGHHPPIDTPGITSYGRLDLAQPADRAKLEFLFRQATCFVMPSFVESFGIVYVEAAAAGVPSIGTVRGGTKTSVGDGGLLVDPTDDDAIFGAMRRMCEPSFARMLGARAQARAGEFTWRKVAERVVRAFDPTLADERGFASFLS
jgi:glycosyltransferase involved in cell wall biosynthesis